jgi:hypothetical protein
MNTGAPMAVLKRLFLILFSLVALCFLFSKADAKNQEAAYRVPVGLISKPCSYTFEFRTHDAPDRVGCVGPEELNELANGNVAFISVPVPKIVKKEPELSLVGVPSFFLMTWDEASFTYADSAPVQYYEWTEDNVRNRLVNVRVQMRLSPAVVQGNEYELIMGNVGIDVLDDQALYIDSDTSSWKYSYSSNVKKSCIAAWSGEGNSLLTIPWDWGGWQDDDQHKPKELFFDMCGVFTEQLNIEDYVSFFGDNEELDFLLTRYHKWGGENALVTPSIIGIFSNNASTNGAGSEHGSPAYRIRFVVYAKVEARVIWDRHDRLEEKREKVWDCSWDYYEDYEEIEWERWPEPIFCKTIYQITRDWVPLCRPSMGTCGEFYNLKNSDSWWISVDDGIYVIQADTVLAPDRNGYQYKDHYDVVVIQAQPLLIAP